MAKGSIFEEGFKLGEVDAIEAIDRVIKKFNKLVKKPGGGSKEERKDVLNAFSGWSAGFIASSLLRSYLNIIDLLRKAGESETSAEVWAQKVVTAFGEAVTTADKSVKLRFEIKRG